MEQIKSTIKDYILNEFLPGEDPAELTDTTTLISGGILDSLATLKLVTFLEEKYGVEFQPHELGAEYMDTIPAIVKLVSSKM
jgi:acyl carrier protein